MNKKEIANRELLDIVNLVGEPTGQQLDKGTIHQQGLWHRDVHVWVTDGQRLLQQQRAWDKTIMPGAWDISVGGHVAAGEGYLEAAIRETEEELGLRFSAERFVPIGKLATEVAMEDGAWMHRIVGDNFVVIAPGLSLDDLELQASEVIGARFYDLGQLEQDISGPELARQHAPQPYQLWHLGLTGIRAAMQ
jgi:isopentenyl-diphosphate delta-isomerase